MQKLKRFWREALAFEVSLNGRHLLVGCLLWMITPQLVIFACWMRWGSNAPARNDQAILEKHERLVKKLWPNGFKPFVPVPAIAFTNPPDGSLGEHVCTAQGCGTWQVDAEWACRTEEGRWDAENWRCVER